MKGTSAIVFAGVAAATWTNAPSFNTPANSDNKCTSQEQSGYSWGNLQLGSVSSYDGFSLSGFQCSNSFGKRDPLSKRTFGGRVIQGQLSSGSGPSLSCSGDKKDFSISEYQVSVSKDTDVEFHYKMSDGTTCQHTSPCSSGGTIVQNSQCGGAQEVTFQLPQGSGSGCQIGIHSIGFDCSPPASSVPYSSPSSSPTPSAPASSPVLPTTSSVPIPALSSSTPASPVSSCAYGGSGEGCSSSSEVSSSPAIPTVPSSSPAVPTVPSSSPALPTVPSSSTPVSPETSSSSSPASCAYGGYSAECSSSSSVPVPVLSSSTPASCAYGGYGAECSSSSSVPVPVLSSSTPAGPVNSTSIPYIPSSSVPVPAFSSSTPASPVTTSSVVPSSSVVVPSSSIPASPLPSAPCPDVVPQCLNTWIQQTGCKDNADFKCYCKQADFTKKVIQCITAYGADTTEIQKALGYVVGICAAFVPQNPGLITNCPSSIPLTGVSVPPASSTPVVPVPAASSSSSTPVAPIPESSSSSTPGSPIVPSSSEIPLPSVVLTTVVVSTSVTTCPAGQTITAAGSTSVLTAPSASTIYISSTTTLTVCTKCTAEHTSANPAAPVPESSTPAAPVPESSTPAVPVSASTTPVSPVTTSPPGVPYTTISVVQTLTVPCTYSTGVSMGSPIPSSSTVTTLSTSAVVPQVQFTTATAGSTPAVGLAPAPTAYGTSPAPAATSVAAVTTGILTAASSFGTTYVPTAATSSALAVQTVNAAPRIGSGVVGIMAGGAFALFAL